MQELTFERQQAIYKLINDIKKYNIEFSRTDGEFNNVVFTRNGEEHKIAYRMFFRQSGRSARTELIPSKVKAKQNFIKVVQIDDNEFYNWFKMLLLVLFKIEKI